jgi:hypothetical protein
MAGTCGSGGHPWQWRDFDVDGLACVCARCGTVLSVTPPPHPSQRATDGASARPLADLIQPLIPAPRTAPDRTALPIAV